MYPETFAEMEAVLIEREGRKKKSGRPAALSVTEQLLMTLEFWREYRTFALTLLALGRPQELHQPLRPEGQPVTLRGEHLGRQFRKVRGGPADLQIVDITHAAHPATLSSSRPWKSHRSDRFVEMTTGTGQSRLPSDPTR